MGARGVSRAPQSLLAAIRSLGGINMREIRDLTGEGRTGRGGFGVGVFRKPSAGKKSGLKATGFGLDEMIERLRSEGFSIPDDPVDGGLEYLRDMIRDEISGHKVYADADQETIWQRQARERAEFEREASEQPTTYNALPRFIVEPAPIPNRYIVKDAHAGQYCPTIAAALNAAPRSGFGELPDQGQDNLVQRLLIRGEHSIGAEPDKKLMLEAAEALKGAAHNIEVLLRQRKAPVSATPTLDSEAAWFEWREKNMDAPRYEVWMAAFQAGAAATGSTAGLSEARWAYCVANGFPRRARPSVTAMSSDAFLWNDTLFQSHEDLEAAIDAAIVSANGERT